jgi:HD-GYP domain-containing protein (c-di-GMP phosphodiesterase class II)
VAVALSNASLIEELKRQNWSTLTALARAVDAKSSWTAGHSERAAELALKIGQALKLSAAEPENLHRAALLHDIGKIGVSASILDKPGKLTDEECSKMKSHPQLGARVLEPRSVCRVHFVRQILSYFKLTNGTHGTPHMQDDLSKPLRPTKGRGEI